MTEEDFMEDESPIMSGWSITVGELRAAIEGVPDDYEVMLENAEVEDCEISSMHVYGLLPPSLGSVGLLVLGGGQIVTSEYAYLPRFDVWIEAKAGHWKNVPLHDHQFGWTK